MKLLVATRNRHKLDEIRGLLALPALELVSALDYPEIPDVEEDGQTFEENAVKKAAELHRATGLPALADDSGLEVHALGGAPGVYSARYAGEPSNTEANNARLLRELEGVSDRRARFVCVMALVCPGERPRVLRGECAGHIGHACRGTHGFGYDPLFLPEGYEQTFGELGEEVKAGLSHRARAMRLVIEQWRPLLGSVAPPSP